MGKTFTAKYLNSILAKDDECFACIFIIKVNSRYKFS